MFKRGEGHCWQEVGRRLNLIDGDVYAGYY